MHEVGDKLTVGEILTFKEEHADDVAKLYFRAVRGTDRPAGKSFPEYFSRLHLANPWASADVPTLVYREKGRVVGAVGVVPRELEFDGKPIRIATMTLFMVDPEHRSGLPAIQLLGRLLKGPQEFSWTDGASGPVGALWGALGGHVVSQYSYNWIRVLRPLGVARMGLDRIGGCARLLRPLAALMAAPGDFLLSRSPLAMLRKPESPCHSVPASPDELLDCIREIGWREPLKPRYSPETFPWLLREAAASRMGKLRTMVVSDAEGRRIGWFVYYAVPGGASFVLQIGVRGKANFRQTLLALFADAWGQGSVCVKGAAIPEYLTDMTELGCIFRHPYDRVVVHSRTREITDAVRAGRAALTRLDGIGWLRFSQESWEDHSPDRKYQTAKTLTPPVPSACFNSGPSL
jgi:hypothetical protein